MPTIDLAFGGEDDSDDSSGEPNMCGSECSECGPILLVSKQQLSISAPKNTQVKHLDEEDKVDLDL